MWVCSEETSERINKKWFDKLQWFAVVDYGSVNTMPTVWVVVDEVRIISQGAKKKKIKIKYLKTNIKIIYLIRVNQ